MTFCRKYGALSLLVCTSFFGCSSSDISEESLSEISTDVKIDIPDDTLGGDISDVSAGVAAAKDKTKTDSESKAEEKKRLQLTKIDGSTIYLPTPADAPPPTVVEEKTQTMKFEDGSPKVVFGYRKLSDNTLLHHGSYKEYFQNGQLFTEGNYNAGSQEGEWQYWYANGQECRKVTYRNGMPDGEWVVYREDGTKQYNRGFSNGKKNGDWTTYAEDGEKILRERHYDKGKSIGVWKLWYEDGQLHTEFPYTDGKVTGTVREWNKEGKIIKEFEFVNDKQHGTSTTWTPKGEKVVEMFREGKRIEAKEGDGA